MKVLIIGGVAGGASAAARLRRLDETAEIIVLERSRFVSYANCGLPYYVGGIIEDKEALTLQTPKSFHDRFRIDVRVRQEAVKIDPERKIVTIKDLEQDKEYEETYDKLILSPGARPVRLPLPGVDLDRVFVLRTVEDTLAMRTFLTEQKPQKAAVVGGGFIGLELAENLVHQGVEVTIVEALGQVMAPLDYDMACEVHSYLRSKGIKLLLNTGVIGFADRDENGIKKIDVQLKEKEAITVDLVISAVGVSPDTGLAKDAGLKLGIKNSIVVNDKMETSVPDIYAVGDAVQVEHFVTKQDALISLAGPANKQGRIVADNIAGRDSRYKGSQGSSVIKLFDMTVGTTGINEKMAVAAGISYDKVYLHPASHATYYPGASNLSMKVLFTPKEGMILGAQIVGADGVDKRIDVLASAIRTGMTADDLAELELSYAPPYSSAKDPVNMVGFVIGNILNGDEKMFFWYEVAEAAKRPDILLLDIRTEEEYAEGHYQGAVNIPLDELRDRYHEIDQSKKIYVNCQVGLRGHIGCRILSQYGFDCYNLSGGYRFYQTVMSTEQYDGTPTHPCGIRI
ncbi:MAG: FAD-dependent oxidoreductase [Clostridium sp.]